MREIFKHAKTVHFFRLNMGGKKASCALCSAKYPGVRGNDVRVVVEASEETTEEKPLFDVSTYLGNVPVDRQDKITAMADLKDNDFVVWDDKAELSLTAGMPLTGGEDGAAERAYLPRFARECVTTWERNSRLWRPTILRTMRAL